jgi:hypothetical protein
VHVTRVINRTDTIGLVGPMHSVLGNNDTFADTVYIGSVNSAAAMGAANNAFRAPFNITGLLGMNMAPAACTIRVSNTEPLQTTSGMIYVGQARSKYLPKGNLGTWDAYSNLLISHGGPQTFSAAQLATNAVEATCIPMEVEELTNFRTLGDFGENVFTFNATYGETWNGFAPVYVYNPSNIALAIEIEMELRVRPGFTSPFQAAAVQHAPSTERDWFDATRAVIEGGIQLASAVTPFITAAASFL